MNSKLFCPTCEEHIESLITVENTVLVGSTMKCFNCKNQFVLVSKDPTPMIVKYIEGEEGHYIKKKRVFDELFDQCEGCGKEFESNEKIFVKSPAKERRLPMCKSCQKKREIIESL